MISPTCLVKNTALLRDLKDYVEYIAYQQVADGRNATVQSVYNVIRESGIEIDMQTVGHVYNDTLPRDVQEFQSTEEVNEYVLNNYKDAIRRASLLEDPDAKEKKIGNDKPEIYVVNGLLNMFTNAYTADTSTQSDMVKMQTALWKGIQRKLNLPESEKPNAGEGWRDIIDRALGYEQLGITDLNGRLNSIADLYDGMRKQLREARDDMGNEADYYTMTKWMDMVKELEAASYSLLFSRGEAKKALEDIMREAGFAKELSDGKIVFNWNKLAGSIGSVQDIRDNVERVLSDSGYNQSVIEGMKNSLENEFNDLQARNLEKQWFNAKKMGAEVSRDIIDEALTRFLNGKTMQEWIKDGRIETLEQVAEHAYAELENMQFQAAVRNEVINRLKQFFNRNYARVETKEAQAAIKSMGISAMGPSPETKEKEETDDISPLQWIKDNGLHNQQELFDAIDDKLEGRVISDEAAANIKKEFARILDLNNRAEKDLKATEKRLDISPDKKSDIKRLVELHNLGIFETAHERVLNNLIGVPDLQQQDMQDLKALAAAASDLFRDVDRQLGSDIFASRHLQTIQRSIDSIIARNINDKSRALKIVNAIKSFFDVFLTGVLMRPFTLLENIYSGLKEIIVPTVLGKSSLKKEDVILYRKMLSDVSIRGQAFGEEIGNFSPQELYTNTLKWKWGKGLFGKGATLKQKAESLLFATMLPGRVGLMGFDSANKAVITNKVFNNAIYQALTQQGMSKEAATQFMNEALYGKSFQDAQEQAQKMIEKINLKLPDKFKIPVNSRTITTFANDLVKHNLNAGGALSNEVIEAAYKSAYHVAGYGLGHEANNLLSGAIRGYRNRRKAEGERLAKQKDWDKLAMHRLKDTLANSLILRFTGGATNWVYLRIQSGLGVGLATGLMGDWNSDIDFTDKKTIQQSIKDIQNRRSMIARAIVGISNTAIWYAIGYIFFHKDDEEKKKKLQELVEQRKRTAAEKVTGAASGAKKDILSEMDAQIKELESETSAYKAIKGNWELNRLFKKTAPDIMLLHYYLDTDKNEYLGVLDYIKSTTGLASDFSIAAKITEATTLAAEGDLDGANGQLASIAGERAGIPMWQSYKDWGKLFSWIGGNKPGSDFKKPTEFTEGLFGGGMLEDLGFFKRDPKVTILPGIGGKKYEQLKVYGVEKISDMKKNTDWLYMRNDQGDLIFSPTEGQKILKSLESYNDQK